MNKKKLEKEKETKTFTKHEVSTSGKVGVAIAREAALAEEIILVRQSGEIPEVAFHGSLHYLSEDSEGPGIEVSLQERFLLARQVLDRYLEIMLRDLNPDNRDKSLFRGLARCVVNWERCLGFCRQEGLDLEGVRQEVAAALVAFLRRECDDVARGMRPSSVLCTAATLRGFALQLGIIVESLPADWQKLCTGRDRPEGP